MQKIGRFVRISPSLYRLEGEAVYACLRKGEELPAQETEALEIYKRGGTFLYLRRPIEVRQDRLIALAESFLHRPALLFVDNQGDHARHWNMQGWYINGDRMAQAGIVTICGFRIFVPTDCKVRADAGGLSFARMRFGKTEPEECEDGFFSWDGAFRFLFCVGEAFRQEAQIRYEWGGYDAFTKRRLSVRCRTKEPHWATESDKKHVASAAKIKAEVCWDVQKETRLACSGETEIGITGFPPVKMETLSFRFIRGKEEYFLAPFGEGVFLTDGDATVEQKGVFHIRHGDRLELRIEAGAAMLKIHAPFYASGTELEVCTSLPVLPPKETRTREKMERFRRRRLQEGCRMAYHKDAHFTAQAFEMCVCGRDILWFNLYGKERKIPGIALCRIDKALAQAVVSEECFIVLDHRDSELFSIPYTIDKASLKRAGQMGYPMEECDRLARFYPNGQIFLSEVSFWQGIDRAACGYQTQIRDACHHFRIEQSGREFTFEPTTWEAQAIFLAVKKGKRFSVTEWANDAKRWDLWSEGKEEAQQRLLRICEEAHGSPWEAAFTRKEWEGGIVIFGNDRSDEQRKFLVLQDQIRGLL